MNWHEVAVPLGWVRTQMNLGTALSTLRERESGTARLKEATARALEFFQLLTLITMKPFTTPIESEH